MLCGIGRFTGLDGETAEETERAEGLGRLMSRRLISAGPCLVVVGACFCSLGALLPPEDADAAGVFTFFFLPFWPASSGSSVFLVFFFSTRAIASASHAAFNLPRAAGRLLFHCRERASPAIASMLRLLSTDSSISPASYPSTT